MLQIKNCDAGLPSNERSQSSSRRRSLKLFKGRSQGSEPLLKWLTLGFCSLQWIQDLFGLNVLIPVLRIPLKRKLWHVPGDCCNWSQSTLLFQEEQKIEKRVYTWGCRILEWWWAESRLRGSGWYPGSKRGDKRGRHWSATGDTQYSFDGCLLLVLHNCPCQSGEPARMCDIWCQYLFTKSGWLLYIRRVETSQDPDNVGCAGNGLQQRQGTRSNERLWQLHGVSPRLAYQQLCMNIMSEAMHNIVFTWKQYLVGHDNPKPPIAGSVSGYHGSILMEQTPVLILARCMVTKDLSCASVLQNVNVWSSNLLAVVVLGNHVPQVKLVARRRQ